MLISPRRPERGRLGELRLQVISFGTGDADLPFAPVEYLLRPFAVNIPLQ
jgi:hypothetical protein